MKHFPQTFKRAIWKLIGLLFPELVTAPTADSEGGIDCVAFDEEHRHIWHENGFSDEEVHAICIAVGCCTNEES